jgi:putative copper export protein
MVDTPYGRALFVKLGLMIFLLAAGGMNLLDRGEDEAFGRVVGLELVLAILVFVATGFLTTLPPPGAEGQATEEEVTTPAENPRRRTPREGRSG